MRDRDEHRPGRFERGQVEKRREKKRRDEEERDEVADAVAVDRARSRSFSRAPRRIERDRRGGRDEEEEQHGEVVAQLRRVLDRDAADRRHAASAERRASSSVAVEKDPGRKTERREPKERADDARGEVVSLLSITARSIRVGVVRASAPTRRGARRAAHSRSPRGSTSAEKACLHGMRREPRPSRGRDGVASPFSAGDGRGIAFSAVSTSGRNTSSRGSPSWSCCSTSPDGSARFTPRTRISARWSARRKKRA